MVFRRKVDLGGLKCTSRTSLSLDQSSPDFIRRTPEESLSTHWFLILDIAIRPGDIRDKILKLYEVNLNVERFSPFLGGGPPKFWD